MSLNSFGKPAQPARPEIGDGASTIIRLLLLASVGTAVNAALLPPSYIRSVVAIGHNEAVQSPAGPTQRWKTDGSGFLYGYLVENDPEPSKRKYEVYLVTNKHVIGKKELVWVRLNPTKTSEQGKVFQIPARDSRNVSSWGFHPSADIAAARINNIQMLKDEGINIDFIANDTHSASVQKMRDIEVSAGDPVFLLGFPMGLTGQSRNYTIVRFGAIARISDLLDSAAGSFLIDANNFPGNSGGPVILQPTLMSVGGTKSVSIAYLIGVVRAYIPYQDVAVSAQTGEARVIFQENSGLAEVVPVDRIDEAIRDWRNSLPGVQKEQ